MKKIILSLTLLCVLGFGASALQAQQTAEDLVCYTLNVTILNSPNCSGETEHVTLFCCEGLTCIDVAGYCSFDDDPNDTKPTTSGPGGN